VTVTVALVSYEFAEGVMPVPAATTARQSEV
jgi:hypothetical protein